MPCLNSLLFIWRFLSPWPHALDGVSKPCLASWSLSHVQYCATVYGRYVFEHRMLHASCMLFLFSPTLFNSLPGVRNHSKKKDLGILYRSVPAAPPENGIWPRVRPSKGTDFSMPCSSFVIDRHGRNLFGLLEQIRFSVNGHLGFLKKK